jgi:signal transduction histidine kinase
LSDSNESRLKYLHGLNQLSRVLQQNLEIETVLQAVVEELVTLFGCDLALLGHPGDPDADVFTMPFQAVRAPYATLTRDPVPLIPSARAALRDALASTEPLVYGPEDPFVQECAISGVQHPQSLVLVMVRPRVGAPWCFEMHQCSHRRVWLEHELNLFRDIGVRVGDVLSNLLLHREQKRTAEALAATNARLESSLHQLVDAQKALRESEDRLRHAQKMEALGRLAGGIAHDFNNLLTVIGGFGSLASEIAARQAHEPLQAHLHEILKASDRAQTLTAQLLAFSRRQSLNPTVADLNAILKDMHQLLSRLLGDDVEVVMNLEPRLNQARIDRGQMEQVILNLAVNARDAMPLGGRCEVSTRSVDHEGQPFVSLSVRDNGVGMTHEVMSRVFEPFFTTKEVGKGTGLGLASVFGIVTQSGGTIAVDSAPGEGATFTIRLPAETARAAAAAGVRPEPIGQEGGCERLLLVEDDASVRRLLAQVLERSGYQVIFAADGQAALELDRNVTDGLDLLITDLLMPRLGGVELARRMQLRRPGLRVLFVTAHAGDQRSLATPVGDLLEKPFAPDTLLDKVREILGRPSAAASIPSAGSLNRLARGYA